MIAHDRKHVLPDDDFPVSSVHQPHVTRESRSQRTMQLRLPSPIGHSASS